MNPKIKTNLHLKWGVQVKNHGYNAEDYFSSDDFQEAMIAYNLASKNITGRDLEWVALFSNGRMTPNGWSPISIRYLHDNRTNNSPIGRGISDLINSLESDWF